jgi:hypothetical protein
LVASSLTYSSAVTFLGFLPLLGLAEAAGAGSFLATLEREAESLIALSADFPLADLFPVSFFWT